MMTAPLEKAVEALRSHLTAPGALMPEDLVQAGLPGTAHAMRLALALLAALDADPWQTARLEAEAALSEIRDSPTAMGKDIARRYFAWREGEKGEKGETNG